MKIFITSLLTLASSHLFAAEPMHNGATMLINSGRIIENRTEKEMKRVPVLVVNVQNVICTLSTSLQAGEVVEIPKGLVLVYKKVSEYGELTAKTGWYSKQGRRYSIPCDVENEKDQNAIAASSLIEALNSSGLVEVNNKLDVTNP